MPNDNLATFARLADEAHNASLIPRANAIYLGPDRDDMKVVIKAIDELQRKFADEKSSMYRRLFSVAVSDYVVGEPVTDENGTVEAGFSAFGLCGVMLFRDNEVTLHT